MYLPFKTLRPIVLLALTACGSTRTAPHTAALPDVTYTVPGTQPPLVAVRQPGSLQALSFTPVPVLTGGTPRSGLAAQSISSNDTWVPNATLMYTGNYTGPAGNAFTINWYVNAANTFKGYAAYTYDMGGASCNIYVSSNYAPRRRSNPYTSIYDSGAASDAASGVHSVINETLPNAGYWSAVTDVITHEFGHCVDAKTYGYTSNGALPQNGAKYGTYFATNNKESYAQAFAEQFKDTCGAYEADLVLLQARSSCTRPGSWSMTLYSLAPIGGKVTSSLSSYLNANLRCVSYEPTATSPCVIYAYYQRTPTP